MLNPQGTTQFSLLLLLICFHMFSKLWCHHLCRISEVVFSLVASKFWFCWGTKRQRVGRRQVKTPSSSRLTVPTRWHWVVWKLQCLLTINMLNKWERATSSLNYGKVKSLGIYRINSLCLMYIYIYMHVWVYVSIHSNTPQHIHKYHVFMLYDVYIF